MDVSQIRSGLKGSSRSGICPGCCLPLRMTNKILALKYRPQEFNDLIGQEIISKTITNSILKGKTPNAYLLTGIRGVGKTTTARLIAKALNCEKANSEKINCNVKNFCNTCKEIVNSNHIDVLEMDAASKTGIDDVRELIENSKYSPASAKFKIFIIDEVHMLSKQAFNGLLKTLEEPPPSLKFILATTEIRKIPLTIISRCQRFDLKRVGIEEIFLHLKNISQKEKGNISDNALKIISKVSEGSVRDALSLLDRVITFQNLSSNNKIEESDVRNMLGIIDKGKIIILLKEILSGNSLEAVKILKSLYEEGMDTRSFLNDILELLNLINRKISLGSIDKDQVIPENEINLINEISNKINITDIGLFWQFTIKTIEDLKVISDDYTILEMYVLQLIHLKDFGNDREEIKNIVTDKTENTVKITENKNKDIPDPSKPKSKTKNQLKNTDQIENEIVKNPRLDYKRKGLENIKNFADIVSLADKENEIELKYDLERNVKLVNFKPGNIDISFNEKLNKNFIKILTEKLLNWTGERWIISLSKNSGEKTLYEKKIELKKLKIEDAKKDNKINSLLETFKDAKLTDVEDIGD